ncbi:MAG: PriCT-2 domain-containing protein [Alphaproteobacteria bacterium]
MAPGSVHPNGERYEWDALNVLTGTPAHAPAKLLDIIERKQIAANDSRKRDDDDIEAEALADMLEALDPADFRAHDEWLELMMACHESTGGAGADEFISWSISDPEYANQANVIRERWRGLKCSGGVTRATLGRRAAKPRSSGAVRASQERRAACLPATTGAKRTEQPSNRRPREVLVRCRHAWRRPWPDDYWSGQNWAGPQTNWRA